MVVKETPIKGLLVIEPAVFNDSRGYFFEAYNKEKYKKHGITNSFVQDNVSKSTAGVLRGLHFQNPPFAQGKLVSVLKGSVLDVVVDIRKGSETYGQHFSIELSEKNKTQLYIPEGFAHGFLTLEDDTYFSYKCTHGYNKASEGSIIWNDSDLNIDWNVENPIVSEKDLHAPFFKDFQSEF